MASAPDKIVALRELLTRRFPQTSQCVRGRYISTGIPAIDGPSGGLPIGALTEVVCTAPSCGGMLILTKILAACRAQQLRVALIDGSNSFDPQSFTSDELAHIVWVRCQKMKQAMQAADLLTRDANFGLVIIDLRWQSERQLRQELPTVWYRLQRAAEQNQIALLVETSRPTVPSAVLRFTLTSSFNLADLDIPRVLLADAVVVELSRQRRQLEQEAG